MRSSRVLGAFVMVVSVLVVGMATACGDDNKSSSAAAPTAVPTVVPTVGPLSVTTMDNSFSPNALTGRAGQKITINLKNGGQRSHTFTIDGLVDSGRMAAGDGKTIEFTPAQAGTLTFYCMVHGAAQMSGTITVSAGVSIDPDTAQGDAFALTY